MKVTQKNYKKGTKKIKEKMTGNNTISPAVSNEASKASKKPAKKASETKRQSQRINVFQISVQFLRDAKTELKKVKWPTKKELLASTTMVLILVLIIALYLGLIDFGLINIINKIVG